MNKEQTGKIEEEFDLVGMVKKIWKKRKTVGWSMLAGLCVGVAVTFFLPNEYTSTVKMIAESRKNRSFSELGGLASLAGINLHSLSEEESLNTGIYPDIVGSTPFLYEMGKTGIAGTTLYGYCYGLTESFREKTRPETFLPASFYRLNRKEQRALNEMKRRMHVGTDRKSGIITVSVTLRDAEAAAVAADSLVAKLQHYILRYRTEKARQDYDFTLGLYEEAGEKYRRTQEVYARFVDANRHAARETVNVERSRLNNEQQLAYGVYSELARQLELAKVKVQEQTPVITVIEPAGVPAVKSAPPRSLILGGFVLLGMLLPVFGIVLREIFPTEQE